MPLYFCLLSYSLIVSNNIYNRVAGNPLFIPGEDYFFIISKYFNLAHADVVYPLFTIITVYLLSKIKGINLIVFTISYVVLDILFFWGYFEVQASLLGNKVTPIVILSVIVYNALRFGLLFLLLPILTKVFKYFLISIPIAILLSHQLAFWSTFIVEIYWFDTIVEWFKWYEIIFNTIKLNGFEGVIVAIVFVSVRKIQSYISSFEYDSISKET